MTALILDEISSFFNAVINIYTELPKQLSEEIKTMQAFLRSYDQKELFLIQNFVKRLQTKAEKIKNQQSHINTKRKNLKTQPDFSPLNQSSNNIRYQQQTNKQNHFNYINIISNNRFNSNLNDINYPISKICDKNYQKKDSLTSLDNFEDNLNDDKGYKINNNNQNNDGNKMSDMSQQMINRYKGIFNQYSSRNHHNSINNNHLHIQRSISLPKQQSPTLKQSPSLIGNNNSNMGINSYREQLYYYQNRNKIIRPKSSPYLQSSLQCESVNCSINQLQTGFAKIQLPQQFSREKKNDIINKGEQQYERAYYDNKLITMRQNISQLNKVFDNNHQQANVLKECLDISIQDSHQQRVLI